MAWRLAPDAIDPAWREARKCLVQQGFECCESGASIVTEL
jgi:hypothetical protein